jgi:creatinine amidohydrolase
MKRFWSDISIQDGERLAKGDDGDWASDWIGILPLGATEQHGAHLPRETDSLIVAASVDRLSARLLDSDKITFLPVEETSYSPEHLDYPGSKSLSYDEAIERWIEIGLMLNSHGLRKLILLNAHGGNSPLMTIVATELRLRASMMVVATSWTRFGTPDGLIDTDELAYGIHGGEIETSVMLALHPKLVELEKLEKFPNLQQKLALENKYLRAYGRHAFGWKIQDLNPRGVVGNASAASAQKGELLLDHSVECLLQLIEEVRRFDIGNLDRADRLNVQIETEKKNEK